MFASFTRSMQFCFGQRRKACVSSVADENSDSGTKTNRRRNGRLIWLALKAPLHAMACLGNESTNSGLEEEDEDAVNRNSIWFATEPSLAQKNYLLVRTSMKYAISM